MRAKLKALLLFALSVFCAVGLTGCDLLSSIDADEYAKNTLDAVYRGETAQYLQTNENALLEDVAKAHADNVQAELDYFVTDYLGLAVCSAENEQRLEELYEKIYRSAKYEVAEAVKAESGYTIEVTVYPIDLFEQAYDEMASFSEYFFSAKNLAALGEITDEAKEDTFLSGILDILLPRTDAIGYNDPETITLAVVKDENGLYTIDRETLGQFDKLLISYDY